MFLILHSGWLLGLFKVRVEYNIVVVLRNILGKPEVLLQEPKQLLRRPVISNLFRRLVLPLQEVAEYLLNSLFITFPMPDLWQLSCT